MLKCTGLSDRWALGEGDGRQGLGTTSLTLAGCV